MSAVLRKNLRASLTDGLAYSLMVGLGESFLSAYVLSRGSGAVAASLISTAPLFIGAILQLFATYGIRRFGSYRRWVLFTASVQTLTLFALAFSTRIELSYAALFAIVSIYWASALATGPAWNTWLAQIIPPKVRVRFFANRSRWSQLLTFLGLALGGYILHSFAQKNLLQGYALLFLLAAAARTVSLWALSRQSPSQGHVSESVDFLGMIKLFSGSRLRRFMLFMLLFQTATNLSSGLFTPFMLNELKLGYLHYMSLLAIALLARFIALAYARTLITRFNLKGVFFFSLILISPMPIFWTHTNEPWLFYLYQIISGVGWGFYELVAFLTLFNDLPVRERASLLTFFNLLQTTGIVLGAAIGGLAFYMLGESFSAYNVVFATSTALRIATLAALPGLPWHLIRLRTWIELRPLSVRAHSGLLSRPIIVRIPLLRRAKKPLLERPRKQ